jgi:hypothetical protein
MLMRHASQQSPGICTTSAQGVVAADRHMAAAFAAAAGCAHPDIFIVGEVVQASVNVYCISETRQPAKA